MLNCNACGNFIVVTKLEILVISLTDFFDAASLRHNDVIPLPPNFLATSSKQPRSQSWRLRDVGCHAASCLPQIHSLGELKQRLIDVWCGPEQSIFDEAIDQWQEDIERVSVLKEDISSISCELTMLILYISVTFNVTCLTVTSLITKSCQQRWPMHSCSFYKVVH